MSARLLEVAQEFSVGSLSADEFVESFIGQWKSERDAAIAAMDSEQLSACLSSVFCLADLYNPAENRESYELDEAQLRNRVAQLVATQSEGDAEKEER